MARDGQGGLPKSVSELIEGGCGNAILAVIGAVVFGLLVSLIGLMIAGDAGGEKGAMGGVIFGLIFGPPIFRAILKKTLARREAD